MKRILTRTRFFGAHRRPCSRRARPSAWWHRKIERNFLLDLFALAADTPQRDWFTLAPSLKPEHVLAEHRAILDLDG